MEDRFPIITAMYLEQHLMLNYAGAELSSSEGSIHARLSQKAIKHGDCGIKTDTLRHI